MRNLLIALICFIFATTAYCQIADLSKVRIEDYAAGMDSKDYPDRLPINQGAYVSNAVINQKGKISSRLGQSLFVKDVGGSAWNGIGRFDPSAGLSYLVGASGVAVVSALSSDTSWVVRNAGHNLTAGNTTQFIQANNTLFVINGFDNTAWWDGANWNAGGTWPTSPPTATTAAWLNNYLFLAGATGNRDWLYISDNLTPTTFQAQQVVKINSGDGQAIKRIEPYHVTDLIVYKERSIYDLAFTGTSSTCIPQPICNWVLTPLTKDIGTIAPRSVVSLGNDQWFLSSAPYAIRSVNRTQFDKIYVNMLSMPIQDIFDGTGTNFTVNTVAIGKSAAIYYDNKYIIAIPVNGSSVNNLVLVYDMITQGWYLIEGWYPSDWLMFNNNLYYSDANTGRVLQCFSGTTGDYGNTSSASGPSVAVNFQYQSRILDFDNPDNYKNLDSLVFEAFPTGRYTANIDVNLDNSGWQSAGTITLSSLAPTLPLPLPFTLYSDGISYNTLQLTKFGQFKKMQVRVSLNILGGQIVLQKLTVFSRLLPWRRE